MKIAVTKEDIEKGVRCNMRYCPVARAIKRALEPKYHVVTVDCSIIIIDNRDYFIPAACSRFILDTDSGKAVAPFEFDLDYEQ